MSVKVKKSKEMILDVAFEIVRVDGRTTLKENGRNPGKRNHRMTGKKACNLL